MSVSARQTVQSRTDKAKFPSLRTALAPACLGCPAELPPPSTLRPQLLRSKPKRIAVLLHSRKHDLAVRPQLLRGELQRAAVLLHGGQHHLTVRPHLRRGVPQRP
eukprot:CAMPEP_0185437540 /NCGR_PEP_ID=MMETSP1365-20130426/31670_1 /TAXON_ID=38817 /ORGANISM="Gephyrocapsa oceanica, Strain RCC1303" /LENGTH=104 /DNA_ID=CAMNT_0028042583 /DNA_START=36 /DNA_END=346 /DNA_ORIENTATION=+